MTLLRIENLKAGYRLADGRNLTVLDIPRFELSEGATLCLRGRSGSGKTTFLNVLAGIRLPEHGQIYFGETNLTALGEAERDVFRGRNMGFIFQAFNLLPGFSALENVLLGSVFAGNPDEDSSVTRQRARELLGKVGLQHREDHRPRMLSSGEQQRVAIARALMNKPRLILADEPTGSLDEKNGAEVLALIRSLARDSGAALLLVTHDPAVMGAFNGILDLKDLNRAGGTS